MEKADDGRAVAVWQHVDQRPALNVGEDGPEAPQLDFVDTQPDWRFPLELLLQFRHALIEHVADGLLIDTNLLGDLGVGVFECLPSNPLGQALCHLPGRVDLGHRRREGLIAWLAPQARDIEVDGHAFAVGWQIADEQRLLGVGNGFVGAPAVRAELGNNGRLCLHMVVSIGFLEVEHPKAREVEDIDGHAALQPKVANCTNAIRTRPACFAILARLD